MLKQLEVHTVLENDIRGGYDVMQKAGSQRMFPAYQSNPNILSRIPLWVYV